MKYLIALILLTGCQKPVCYECELNGNTIYFLDTDKETMQHTIDWWAKQGLEMKCKEL